MTNIVQNVDYLNVFNFKTDRDYKEVRIKKALGSQIETYSIYIVVRRTGLSEGCRFLPHMVSHNVFQQCSGITELNHVLLLLYRELESLGFNSTQTGSPRFCGINPS